MENMRYSSFSSLDSATRCIWSKSPNEDGVSHSLLAHLLDVAAVGEALLMLEPESTRDWAARAFGLPHEYCVPDPRRRGDELFLVKAAIPSRFMVGGAVVFSVLTDNQ